MQKSLYLLILLLLPLISIGQKLQLSKPLLGYKKAIIQKNKTLLTVDFRMDGAKIYYTLDNSEPTEKSKLYTQPVKIKKACYAKVKVFHPDFLPSETVMATFIERGIPIDGIAVNQPSEKYRAKGSISLMDNSFGDENFGKNYLGYDGEFVETTLEFEKTLKIKSVKISMLQNQNAWIFLPSTISVLDEKNKIIAHEVILNAKEQNDNVFKIFELAVPKQKYKKLKIIIDPINEIPYWHQGKGSKAWLFLDEVLVY